MNRLPIPATKSNLLRLRADLEFLEAGRELLEQKREFLSEVLLTFDRNAAALRERVEADLAPVWVQLAEAYAAVGEEGLRRLALAAPPLVAGELRERSLMGATVPLLEAAEPGAEAPDAPWSGPREAGAATDAVAARLRDLAAAIAQLAELETSCRRLTRELTRTRSKLNALEVVHIPRHRDTIRFITDQLEERERESLFQLRRVKGLREGSA